MSAGNSASDVISRSGAPGRRSRRWPYRLHQSTCMPNAAAAWASQASIEDAHVLAGCLKKYAGDPTTAPAKYENARRERTAAVVRASTETRNRAFNHALADAEG